jgi:hypothetical protein
LVTLVKGGGEGAKTRPIVVDNGKEKRKKKIQSTTIRKRRKETHKYDV